MQLTYFCNCFNVHCDLSRRRWPNGHPLFRGMAAIEDPVVVRAVDSSKVTLALARESLAQVPLSFLARSIHYFSGGWPQAPSFGIGGHPCHCRAREVTDLAGCHQLMAASFR